MTTTPPDAPPGGPPPGSPPPSDPLSPGPGPGRGDEGPRVTRDEVRQLARLRRSVDDRRVAGVAGGLARHLDIDPVIVRVGLVVLAIFGGAGLVVYAGLWLLVPEDGSDRAVISLDDRSRTVAVLGIGVLAALSVVGGSWGFWDFPWPLVLIGVVVVLLLSRRRPDGGAPPVSLTKQAGVPQSAATSGSWQPTGGWQAGGPTGPGGTYGARSYPPRPRDPRKRGPILFWFTLALSVLAVGLVGIADVSADVPAAAYPAAVVAVCAVMLLVGAFFGRAGGLIALGLLATVGLAGAAATDHWDGRRVVETPQTAAEVDDDYFLSSGELVLDLSEVSDPAQLRDDAVDLEVGVGRIEVILPDGIDVDVWGEVAGPGEVRLPDRTADGFGVGESARVRVPGPAAGTLDGFEQVFSLNLSVGMGEIEVTQ